jgi:sigma-E factor negative regulatory protein RseC
MLEISARVLRVEGAMAWVQVEAPPSCGLCHGKGCGSSVFNQLWREGEPEYALDNSIAAEVGDAVVIGVADGSVLQAAWRGYGMPLLAALVGAWGLSAWGDLAAAGGMLLGLAAGGWLGRRAARTAAPVVLRAGTAAGCGTAEPTL